MGSINALLLFTIVLSQLYLWCKNTWFREHYPLGFCFFFQTLVLIWRVIFFFFAGH